jgi:dCTP deaminase
MPNHPGALPYQTIREMLQSGYVAGADERHIQPSSLDLSITDEVYRMRGSYLPRPGEPIKDIITRGALYKASIDYPLERGGIYLIRLNEKLKLPKDIHASVSNKSSSGRIDLRARLLADGLARFDSIPPGYQGSLWIEIAPKSFPVRLHPGDRINQIRFFFGNAKLNALEHRFAFDRHVFLRDKQGQRVDDGHVGQDGITMTIDLMGNGGSNDDSLIGWRSHPGPWSVLDTARFDHDPLDFFEPLYRPKNGELILVPGAFYILATKEKIVVPPHLAAEMAPYDPSKGEFRSHFAGFFDPGFGWHQDDALRGTDAVLEVEAFGHECVVHDGQPICLMVYERMLHTPDQLYGSDLKSNYAGQQGPKLAKWFKSSHPAIQSTPSNIPAAPTDKQPTHSPSTMLVESARPSWENSDRFDLG